ncbi:MAG: hypothetical protein ACOX5E_00770 [Bacilli bacterium]
MHPDGSYADQLVIGNEVGVIGTKAVYNGLHCKSKLWFKLM